MKTAVIVLNYNSIKETKLCLVSLKKAQAHSNFSIITVDNNSHDNSQKELKEIKNIQLIQNKANLGYTGGNNKGIKYALDQGANYVLIVNNDVIVDEKFLNPLTHAAKNGISSPKIYFEAGYEFHKARYNKKEKGNVIWFGGGEVDWDGIYGKHTGVDEVDHGQFDKLKEIDYATGACIMIKREVFEKVGLFDEKFFLYLEDMDFCQRAKNGGFKILYQPASVAWHKNAASSGGSGSSLQDYYISRNRLLFAFKYARIRTKIAVFKEAVKSIKNPTKRKALLDFLTCNFGKGRFIG